MIGFDVDAARVVADLGNLARFSDLEAPAVTRVLYTETDLRARAFLKGLCDEAGLTTREDAIGNLFARLEGLEPGLPAVATGSHCDAIPCSGRYDGTVGVLGAIEAIQALGRSGFRPRRPIELIAFTSEEPTRFGVGCLGSRTLAGTITPEGLEALRDAGGRAFDEVRRSAGFSGGLGDVRLDPGHYSAFVELHIEQGPLLERDQIPIGVVTAIAAPATLRVKLDGEGGHAGTVLMPDRRDALCGAAEIILAVEDSAASGKIASLDLVGTTGVCQVHPGAVNGIPSAVLLEIDVRDIDPEPRDRALVAIRDAVARVSERRRLVATIEVLNQDPPARSADLVVQAVEAACTSLGLASRRMVSRAYHDSLFMARVAPTGMIFIPCRGGISHRPEEFASETDIGNGVAVLAGTLAELAR